MLSLIIIHDLINFQESFLGRPSTPAGFLSGANLRCAQNTTLVSVILACLIINFLSCSIENIDSLMTWV
jgi:hypothetical protein